MSKCLLKVLIQSARVKKRIKSLNVMHGIISILKWLKTKVAEFENKL